MQTQLNIDEFNKRLQKAINTLTKMAQETGKTTNEYSRLSGKIEGLKLALEYAREESEVMPTE